MQIISSAFSLYCIANICSQHFPCYLGEREREREREQEQERDRPTDRQIDRGGMHHVT